MSSKDMVMVQREVAEAAWQALDDDGRFEESCPLREALDQPAQQHQAEPVALPARMQESTSFYPTGWNACLDEIAKLGPLYTHPAPAVQQEPVAWLYEDNERSRGTPFRVIVRESRWIELQGDPRFTELPLYAHADPAEVERLRRHLHAARVALEARASTFDTLRAQLAEAQALLRDLDDAWNSHDGREWFGKLMQKAESLLASAEPSAPKCTHRFMSLADSPRRCADCDAVEPSAPVEIDERAEFELAYQRAADCGWTSTKMLSRRIWDARAALERKP